MVLVSVPVLGRGYRSLFQSSAVVPVTVPVLGYGSGLSSRPQLWPWSLGLVSLSGSLDQGQDEELRGIPLLFNVEMLG